MIIERTIQPNESDDTRVPLHFAARLRNPAEFPKLQDFWSSAGFYGPAEFLWKWRLSTAGLVSLTHT
jgi:hypothetical protein